MLTTHNIVTPAAAISNARLTDSWPETPEQIPLARSRTQPCHYPSQGQFSITRSRNGRGTPLGTDGSAQQQWRDPQTLPFADAALLFHNNCLFLRVLAPQSQLDRLTLSHF